MPSTLRQTLRSLLSTPAFSATVVLSLGVAIGACASVFSVVRGIYFLHLPFPEPERLVEIWSTATPSSDRRIDVMPAARMREWLDLEFRTLEPMAARGTASFVLEGDDAPERIEAELVSGGWFAVMGVGPLLGRALLLEDDLPNATDVVVLSEPLWRERFGGDEEILGRTLRLSGGAYTVVGVMPHAFATSRRLWVPAGKTLAAGAGVWFGVARLSEGSSLQDATLEIRQIATAEIAADSSLYGGYGAVPIPLEQLTRTTEGPTLEVIAGVAGVLFLLALTNLTTLFLLRAAERGRGVAVRIALGAGRWQLGRGLLAESALLALASAVLGVLLSTWGRELVRTAMGNDVAPSAGPAFDPLILTFATLLGLLAATALGLEPLRNLRSLDVRSLLERGGGISTLGPMQRRTRAVLVGAQVAITTVLGAFAVVLVMASGEFRRFSLGYDSDALAVAVPDWEVTGRTAADELELGAAAAGRLASHPAVESATYWRYGTQVGWPPVPGSQAAFEGGATELPIRLGLYGYYDVAPGFFETVGIRVASGRDFTAADGPGASPVGIVSASGAAAWWPGQNPIGRRLRLGEQGQWITVVGVAEDAADLHPWTRDFSMGTVTRGHRHLPRLYRPLAQATPIPGWSSSWDARPCVFCAGVVVGARSTDNNGRDVTAALAETMHAFAPDVPLRELGVLTDLQMKGQAGRRARLFRSLVLVVGGIALLLALLGVFGVVADGVSRRRREIGLRVVLGARPRHVLAAVVAESALIASGGLAAGLLVLLASTELWGRSSFVRFGWLSLGPSPTDVRVLGSIGLAALAATLVAALLAARRATAIDPAMALRSD